MYTIHTPHGQQEMKTVAESRDSIRRAIDAEEMAKANERH